VSGTGSARAAQGSTPDGEPVTVVVSRLPRPGCEDALHLWALGMVEQARTFHGHRGAQVFPPIPGVQAEQVIAFSFATRTDLDRWQTSPVRREWLARCEPLTQAPATRHVLTGLEGLFAGQDRSPVVPPPRWKTAVTIWTAVYPLTLLLNLLLAPVVGGWVLPLRSLVTTLLLAPLMVYVGVPFVTRTLYGRWLGKA
jgi:antibiotic biosynthesis monooxygenase (ABM) superfamily enzyme